MTRRPNRIILLVIAVLLLAGAAVALLAAAGLLALPAPADLYQQVEASAAAYPAAWAAGGIILGLLAIWLGAWLVRRQLRIRPGHRLSTVALERGERGRTTFQAAPVSNAVAADLRRVRGVEGSRVRLVTFGSRPRLFVDLTIDRDAPVRDVLDRAEPVHERLRQHLGVERVHVSTTVRPSSDTDGRVT